MKEICPKCNKDLKDETDKGGWYHCSNCDEAYGYYGSKGIFYSFTDWKNSEENKEQMRNYKPRLKVGTLQS